MTEKETILIYLENLEKCAKEARYREEYYNGMLDAIESIRNFINEV